MSTHSEVNIVIKKLSLSERNVTKKYLESEAFVKSIHFTLNTIYKRLVETTFRVSMTDYKIEKQSIDTKEKTPFPDIIHAKDVPAGW